MPYMELRDYTRIANSISPDQRDSIMEITRNHVARGQDIDGTFEFHYLKGDSELDHCEYDYVYVIDMGYSEEREKRKQETARRIGIDLQPILGTDSFAVRLRLQNASFVPFGE